MRCCSRLYRRFESREQRLVLLHRRDDDARDDSDDGTVDGIRGFSGAVSHVFGKEVEIRRARGETNGKSGGGVRRRR